MVDNDYEMLRAVFCSEQGQRALDLLDRKITRDHKIDVTDHAAYANLDKIAQREKGQRDLVTWIRNVIRERKGD